MFLKPNLHLKSSNHTLLAFSSPSLHPSPSVQVALWCLRLFLNDVSVCQHLFLMASLSSLTQSCPTLCESMDCSMPGFHIFHHLLEFAQTSVHQVDDAMQPSHPLSSLFLPPSTFPSIRVFSNESVLLIAWPKYWSFSFSISPSNKYSRLISFMVDWLDLLAIQETLKSLLPHHSSKAKYKW